ncbi:MAG TPA: sulfatase [Thermofilaceae archaeon]|nr:sulfatase [Thermofilaceae archaeon]
MIQAVVKKPIAPLSIWCRGLKREKPNILLIAIDTLRADHLGCYGYYRQTSPTIDELARDGIVFENAIAPGIPTHPSYTTIFTGVHPLKHKIVCHAGSEVLSPALKTMAQYLQESGYATVAVDNLLMTGAPWLVRGFEVYVYSGGITVISGGAKVTGEVVTEKAINVLRAWKAKLYGEKPLFLFVHYWDPHAPYLPPKGFWEEFYREGGTKLTPLLRRTRWGRYMLKGWLKEVIAKGRDEKEYVDALYDGEIKYCDWCISKLLEELKVLDLYEDTVIVITADHGEGLGENNVYYDHHGLYDWDVRVPLIIHYPQLMGGGKRVRELVTHEDILPTVLDLAGVKYPEGEVDGRSLIKLIEERCWSRDFVVCVENTRMTKRAIRTREWKLIETLRPDIYGHPAGFLELYDLRRGEENNLIEEYLDVAKELLMMLEVWYRRKLGPEPDPLSVQQISLPVPG